MLTDTHAHLYWDVFREDFDAVLKRAMDANITTIINVGVDVEKSQIALNQVENELSNIKGLTVYSTIGIHPHEAYKYERNEENLKKDLITLEQIYLKNPKKVIGIGECGLDFFFKGNSDYNPTHLSEDKLKDLQRKLLLSQLELAKKLDLPIIVHIRDDRSKDPQSSECWKEAIELIKDWKGILHCYSGTMEITNNIPQNFLVSFAANITYPKNDYLKEAAKTLPLEKIALETDCPFLAPQSERGKRNEPKSVAEIAQLIAQIKGVTLKTIAQQTSQNVKTLFKIE